MKTRLTFLIIAILTSIAQLFAQSYYYYKGEKIPLTVDNSKVNITTKASFSKSILVKEGIQNMELRQDYSTKDTLLFAAVELQELSGKATYVQKTNILKEKEDVIAVSPYFTRKGTASIGTSHLFYVKLKQLKDTVLLKELADRYNVLIIQPNQFMPHWYRMSVTAQSPGNAVEMANTFYETGLFADIDPAFIFNFHLSCVNDPLFNQQWGLSNSIHSGMDINVCNAWNLTEGQGVKVGIFDNGIDTTQLDLRANIDNLSYDALNGRIPSVFYYGATENHGTHMAGIISAVKNNKYQITGIAPQSKIIDISHPISISLPNLSEQLADGISWAWRVDGGNADILNCSWGDGAGFAYDSVYSSQLEEALDEALTQGRGGKGMVIVFAAGNCGETDENSPDYNLNCGSHGEVINYPANYHPDILCVGAIDKTGTRANFSQYGDKLDVVAPGVDILSTVLHNRTSLGSGTSQAAPHVAGIAALILSVNSGLTVQEVNYIIESTAKKVGGYDYRYTEGRYNGKFHKEMGYGLPDAYEAVSVAKRMAELCNIQLPAQGGIYISSNTTWSTPRKVSGTVTVASGAILTISTDVKFSASSEIIVQQGGRLYIHGGTLYSCGELWKGIQLWGHYNKIQTITDQGVVDMKNATIMNAECAILVGATYAWDWGRLIHGGGIIYAENSSFINNYKNIVFQRYTNYASAASTNETDNRSTFTNCMFLRNINALFVKDQPMVRLDEVRGIKFNGCEFLNNRPLNPGAVDNFCCGIYGNNASIQIGGKGGGLMNPYSTTKRTFFSGFRYAINIIDAGTKPVAIKFANFEHNATAIVLQSVVNQGIMSCNIDLSTSPVPVNQLPNYCGIDLKYCDKYTIENNQIYGSGLGVGLQIESSGINNNTIKYNTLWGHCRATYIRGINGSDSNGDDCTGLQFRCNKFYDNGADFYINYFSRMRLLQGSYYGATGNEFTVGSLLNFENVSPDIVTYFYNGTKNNHEPLRYHYSNRLTPIAVSSDRCIGYGCLEDTYYSIAEIEPISLEDLVIKHSIVKKKLKENKTLYNEKYSSPIDWKKINEILNEGIEFKPDHQMELYFEIAELQEELSMICQQAYKTILENEVFIREDYNQWLQNEGTLKSLFSLAESYVEISEWDKAKNVFEKIPMQFPNYNEKEYEGFITCLNYQYKLNKDPHIISVTDSLILESIVKNPDFGFATVKAEAILACIGKPLTCHSGGESCPFEEYKDMAKEMQKNMGNDNPIIKKEIDNELIIVNIYPNPAGNMIYIELDNLPKTPVDYILYDMQGKQLSGGNFNSRKHEMDISSLSTGMYFLRFKTEDCTPVVKKVIKN